MNANVLLDAPFDSEEGWEAFDLLHGHIHQTAYLALLRQGKVPIFYPLMGFPRRNNEEYLLDHWAVHQSQARLLGIGGVPDLSVVDFTDRAQFDDWLQLHAAVHARENAALEIT